MVCSKEQFIILVKKFNFCNFIIIDPQQNLDYKLKKTLNIFTLVK